MFEAIAYYSTNGKAPKVSFEEALLKGLAPDGGLFMPENLPQFTTEDLQAFKDMPYHELAYSILHKFLGDTVPNLKQLTQDAYNFDVPLEPVVDRHYVMRLDQGPTASFKDFAARMMGRLMQYFLSKDNSRRLILTATSGDTGSAIANAFYGLDNIKVVVLYPEKEVTARQRQQMTTLHDNIQTIALNGKFDDCQALVKQAFVDQDLARQLAWPLNSANSINIGRLLPQSVYYVYAWSRLSKSPDDKPVFSVPSGNFGDLMGGLLAKSMGLPVRHFIAATNANDAFPKYMEQGTYAPIAPSRNCISSAMNVGHPSNMARLFALYGGMMNEKGEVIQKPDETKVKQDITALCVCDTATKSTIHKAYNDHRLLLEPHGAVGWAALEHYLSQNKQIDKSKQLCISLETAHPAKFPETIQEVLSFDPELPEALKGLDGKTERSVPLENDYQMFREFLTNNYS